MAEENSKCRIKSDILQSTIKYYLIEYKVDEKAISVYI